MKELNIDCLNINPCKMIGKDWMIISAGNENNFNMMTASWGHIGSLWGKSLNGKATVEIFVRPSRYTDRFIDQEDYFSLSFFTEEYKNDILYLGSHSGINENKILNTNLTPVFIDNIPCYKEAKLTIIARKIYKGKIEKEGFVDKTILDNFYNEEKNNMYCNLSFHNVYIGEILKVIINEQ